MSFMCWLISFFFLHDPSSTAYLVDIASWEDNVEVTLIGESDDDYLTFETLTFYSGICGEGRWVELVSFYHGSGKYRLSLENFPYSLMDLQPAEPRVPAPIPSKRANSRGIDHFAVHDPIMQIRDYFFAFWTVSKPGRLTLEFNGKTVDVTGETRFLGHLAESGHHLFTLRLIGADGLIDKAEAQVEVVPDCQYPSIWDGNINSVIVMSDRGQHEDSIRLEYNVDGVLSILPLVPVHSAQRFRIFPGDWDHLFDQLTFILNKGHPTEPVPIWISQYDVAGEEILTIELIEALHPYDAETVVIGGPHERAFFSHVIDQSYVEVHGPEGIEFSVLAIQGHDNLRWRNHAIPIETEDDVKSE